jgi:hypothetical protein
MWICWIEIPPTRTKYWTVLPTRYRKMNSNRKLFCTPTKTATSANWLSFSIKMHYRTKGRVLSLRTNFSSVVLTSANKKTDSRTDKKINQKYNIFFNKIVTPVLLIKNYKTSKILVVAHGSANFLDSIPIDFLMNYL